MPTKDQILYGLTSISNQYIYIAITWHILFYLLIVLLFSGWKPSNRAMILLLTLPLLSVSSFAIIAGNIFNSIVFGVAAIGSAYIGMNKNAEKISGGRSWADIAGLCLVVFGLLYPEFLKTASIVEYSYSAPTGLIPCPTLSILIGFSLLYKNFQSKPWALLITSLGIFYGTFGAFKLGVRVDFVLLAGALILLLNTLFIRYRSTVN